jgi:hypothetical protein
VLDCRACGKDERALWGRLVEHEEREGKSDEKFEAVAALGLYGGIRRQPRGPLMKSSCSPSIPGFEYTGMIKMFYGFFEVKTCR